MPIKPLTFKGEKKSSSSSKKRKASSLLPIDDPDSPFPPSSSTTPISTNNIPLQDDDNWVTADVPTDLSGPTLLVLPTHPTPTALACDATGAVFASPLENLIEGDPATAEPHDVRQVWVATQIPGALVSAKGGKDGGEEQVMVSFKGFNGRYLGCGRGGFLRAEAVAVGVTEGFRVRNVEREADGDGIGGEKFVVGVMGGQGDGEEKEKLICVEEEVKKGWEVRGDGEGVTDNTMLRIRMQARFKPRLKASKEMKAKEKISRRELEAAVGRRLEDDEVKRLKRARRNGTYHEEVLDVRVKGKHDKFAS